MGHVAQVCDDCGRRPAPGSGWRARARSDGKRYCPACREKHPIAKSEHRCSRCSIIKPISEFYTKRDGQVSRPCKPCILIEHRLERYGVSEEEFDRMYLEQAGCCAICEHPMGAPHLDHCHVGGQPRGLLCNDCNTGLGMFDDDPDRLVRAAEYLLRQVDLLGGLRG